MLVCSMGLAAPAGANVDQCAPPGIQSASALPTNLAKAATGPGADKYTTATVEPLTAVNVNALAKSAETSTRRPATSRRWSRRDRSICC
jgi:polar amino acid transport system substrate-binding protein